MYEKIKTYTTKRVGDILSKDAENFGFFKTDGITPNKNALLSCLLVNYFDIYNQNITEHKNEIKSILKNNTLLTDSKIEELAPILLNSITKDKFEDMLIVEEMYARGIEFTPVDIYKAQSRKFIIENGKIMPSFKVIDKVGEKAGENIVIAASQGPFISHEDLMRRGGIGQVAVDRLVEIGALKGMAQKNQISIFDVV